MYIGILFIIGMLYVVLWVICGGWLGKGGGWNYRKKIKN